MPNNEPSPEEVAATVGRDTQVVLVRHLDHGGKAQWTKECASILGALERRGLLTATEEVEFVRTRGRRVSTETYLECDLTDLGKEVAALLKAQSK